MLKIAFNVPRSKHFWFLLLLPLLILTAQAQEKRVLLVGVPFGNSLVSEELLQQFEVAHPDVDVQIVEIDTSFLFPNPLDNDTQNYAQSIQALVEQADVLLVNDNIMYAPLLSGAFFLDIAPLAASDTRFAGNDFYPVMLNAFRDGQGSLWGLAAGVTISTILYNPDRLQEANVNAPHAGWLLSDYEAAAVSLHALSGESSLLMRTPGSLLRGLWNESLEAAGDERANPQFAHPGLTALIQDWQDLEQRGFVDSDAQAGDLYAIQLAPITDLLSNDSLQAAALPGNAVDLFAWGFGVSAGTQEPDMAYELAAYLTSEIDLSPQTSSLPTRLDRLETVLAVYTDPDRAFIEAAMAAPPALIERLYTLVLTQAATTDRRLEDLDVQVLTLVSALSQASHDVILTVPTPIPTPSGEGITLRFGIDARITGVYYREWQQLIEDFVAQDQQISDLVLVSPEPRNSFSLLSEQSDCFYMPGNRIASLPDTALSLLQSLSPFIATDPTFDAADFIGTDLRALQRQDQTWALPVAIMPSLLQIDQDQFESAGITPPPLHWSASDFELALRQLQPNLSEETPPMFLPASDLSDSPSHILMLIAAYGGLPIDYRTTPSTIDFTSPEVVAAITNVLDLAREDVIDYSAQSANMANTSDPMSPIPIVPVNFGSSLFKTTIARGQTWASFPEGQTYTPVSFNIGAGYISRLTNEPDICYRWLRTLAQNPYLFFGLPAYRSLITTIDPAVTPASGFIQDYADLITSPNVVMFPSVVSSWEGVERSWLYEAFDDYVLQERDLTTELSVAEMRVHDFRACQAGIPPTTDNTFEEIIRVSRETAQCAVDVDPRLAASDELGGLLR